MGITDPVPKHYIYYIWLYIFSVGGVTHVDSFSGANCFNFSFNYFTMNFAIMGAVFDLNIYAGPICIFLQGNTYVTNRGYDSKSHIGSGSVLKMLAIGPYIGVVSSFGNKYINNLSEINGNSINILKSKNL